MWSDRVSTSLLLVEIELDLKVKINCKQSNYNKRTENERLVFNWAQKY